MSQPVAKAAPASAPRLQLRPPTGLVAFAVLLIAFSAWLVVGYPLVIAGDDLDLAFTTNNVLYLVLTATVPASLTLALGAAAVRSVWLAIVALVVSILHGTSMLVMLIVQGVGGARSELIAETGLGVGALVLATIGSVLALLAAVRARRRFSSAPGLTISAAIVLGIAYVVGAVVPAATAIAGATIVGYLSTFGVMAAVALAAALAGGRRPAIRIVAAVLAVVAAAAVVVVALPTLTGPALGDPAWLIPMLALDAMRTIALLAAAGLLLASLRGLSRWRGRAYDPAAMPSTAVVPG